MSSNSKIEIDWFWVFIIGMFVVMPLANALIDKLPGGKNDSGAKTQTIAGIEESAEINSTSVTQSHLSLSGFIEMVVERNSATAIMGQKTKFTIGASVIKVVAKAPSDKEIRCEVKKNMAYVVFEEEGSYNVTTYDKNGLSVKWFKVNVQ